ncbi:glycosyl hydrolase family 8 [Rheinheimera sp.]|uniref:glycosyl hydrolase family 8 n=1 Tax=Rheinheimera sp. TaxID=1869214 RepID=UPI0027368830|nr:glycosyl hydrolase family 8 [Rheinheimera sp.]MDP2716895.1 glycosyl hydrolase family 8 [Rheinheimera sp.]
MIARSPPPLFSWIKLHCWLALWLLLSACATGTTTAVNSAAIAPSGSALSGQYRNLFAELGYTGPAIDARINRAFNQLFYGDAATEAVYFPAGSNADGDKAYILDVNNNDVRSEGMSYGMMIAVQLNKQAEFNALWNWAHSHMYQADPGHPAYGYFAWSVRSDGIALDEMPAPDGEEYFATALYFAAVRWGDGSGIYQYKAQADQLLTQMRHRRLITGNTQRGSQTGTNLFHPHYAMVRFTPDLANAEHTDASYHLPAFYQVWARMGPEADRAFWQKAARVSRDYFSKAAHPATGLTPDYGNFDGSPWAAPWRPESADFRFDAWRTAMNWSVDWSWWRFDTRAVELSDRLQAFFASEGLNNYGGQYSLEGKKLDPQQTTGPTAGIVAMNAVASLAASQPRAADFVHALWQQPVPTGQYRYYDGMLYLLGLLHVSGRFQAWLPPQQTDKTE